MVRELGASFLNSSEKVIGSDIINIINYFIALVFKDSLLSNFSIVLYYANF